MEIYLRKYINKTENSKEYQQTQILVKLIYQQNWLAKRKRTQSISSAKKQMPSQILQMLKG